MTDPLKVFDRLLSCAVMQAGGMGNSTYAKPGALIERLSSEDREALKQLRSSDISSDQLPFGVAYGLPRSRPKKLVSRIRKIAYNFGNVNV